MTLPILLAGYGGDRTAFAGVVSDSVVFVHPREGIAGGLCLVAEGRKAGWLGKLLDSKPT